MFPASLDDYWQLYAGKREMAPRLQSHLSRAISVANYLREHRLLPIIERIMDDTEEAKHPTTTGLWLTAVPNLFNNQLSNGQLRAAVRHRYDLPCRDDLPARCACDQPLVPSHFHSCLLTKAMGATPRHDGIVNLLAKLSSRAGIITRIEPVVRDAAGHRTRPDLFFATHAGRMYIDVAVCSTHCDSNRLLSDPLATRERQKTRKYGESCAREGADFLPFALSSAGELGTSARRVIDLIVSQHHNRVAKPDPKLTATITTAVCVQLQAGNAMVNSAGLSLLASRPRAVGELGLHPIFVARRPPATHVSHDTLRRRPDALPAGAPAGVESKEVKGDAENAHDGDSKRSSSCSERSPLDLLAHASASTSSSPTFPSFSSTPASRRPSALAEGLSLHATPSVLTPLLQIGPHATSSSASSAASSSSCSSPKLMSATIISRRSHLASFAACSFHFHP